MKSRTLLAPVLTAFGLILGAPALGDDPTANDGTTAAPIVDVAVVGAPSDWMTLCLSLNNGTAPLPCEISAENSTLAGVTLYPGDNYVAVPVVDPVVIGVTSMPENPGSN